MTSGVLPNGESEAKDVIAILICMVLGLIKELSALSLADNQLKQ